MLTARRHDSVLPLAAAIQRHVAVGSIVPSTVSGQGARGVVPAVRDFLATLPLRPFSVNGEGPFRQALDSATNALVARLPATARSWGMGRKCLNLFLRDA